MATRTPTLIDILSKRGITPATVDSISIQSNESNPDDIKTVILSSSQEEALWDAFRSARRPEAYIIEPQAMIHLKKDGSDSEPYYMLNIDNHGVIHPPLSDGGLAFYYSMEAYEVVNDALGGRLLPPE